MLEITGHIALAAGISMLGSSGSGKGEYREKTKGANSNDRTQVDHVARDAKIDRRKFGDFIESVKEQQGRRPSDNFSYKELQQLAQEFKELYP